MKMAHIKVGTWTQDAPQPVTKQFSITALPEFMVRFERFLALLQHNGGVGHSAHVGIFIDGDGQDHPKFDPEPDVKFEVMKKGHYPDEVELAMKPTVFNV